MNITKQEKEELKRLIKGLNTEDGRDYLEDAAIWLITVGPRVLDLLANGDGDE